MRIISRSTFVENFKYYIMKTTINYQQELGDIESPKQKAQRIALEEKISITQQKVILLLNTLTNN